MDEVFSLTLRHIGGRRTTPTPLTKKVTKKVPQYGGGDERTGPVVVVGGDGAQGSVLGGVDRVESVIAGSVIGKKVWGASPVVANDTSPVAANDDDVGGCDRGAA